MNIIIMVITAVLMYCVSTLCWGLYHLHSFWSSELSSKVGIILFFSKWEKHALRKWIIFPKVIQLVSVHRLTHALWSLSPPVMSSLSMETLSPESCHCHFLIMCLWATRFPPCEMKKKPCISYSHGEEWGKNLVRSSYQEEAVCPQHCP